MAEVNTKLCVNCGTEKPLDQFGKLKSRPDGLSFYCRNCNVIKSQQYYRNHKEERAEYGRIYNEKDGIKLFSKYRVVKGRARARGIDFPLSREDFIEWFRTQSPYCHYCNQPVEERLGRDRGHNDRTIDRKDTSIGYVLGNMVFACRRCNTIKGYWFSEKEMLEIADKYLKGKMIFNIRNGSVI